MKNSLSVATKLHPLTPAQVKLVNMFDHFDVECRLNEINYALEWSFSVDFDLDDKQKEVQYTMWHLIKILTEINKEKPIQRLSMN